MNAANGMPRKADLVRFVEQQTRQKVNNTGVKKLRLADPYRAGFIDIVVGEMLDPRISSTEDELVWAIFETGHFYMIITPSRGGLRDRPYLYRRGEVVSVE